MRNIYSFKISSFQIIIGSFLALILIGGLGTITLAMFVTMLSGRKVSLFQRSVMKDAISADQYGGLGHFTLFILKGTLAAELLGVLLLFPSFFRRFPLLQSIQYSVFHSVSAFCNAGFDLMGKEQPYPSLTSFSSHALLNLTIMRYKNGCRILECDSHFLIPDNLHGDPSKRIRNGAQ